MLALNNVLKKPASHHLLACLILTVPRLRNPMPFFVIFTTCWREVLLFQDVFLRAVGINHAEASSGILSPSFTYHLSPTLDLAASLRGLNFSSLLFCRFCLRLLNHDLRFAVTLYI